MRQHSFGELCRLEPRLADLFRDALAVEGSDEHFCANWTWYRELKPRLLQLVGWHAERPELRTMEDYDTAYQTIYEALPPCNACSCLRLEAFGLSREEQPV